MTDSSELQGLMATLNAPECDARLQALRALKSKRRPACGKDVNNHIHTTYSFSPYSPTKAAWLAGQAGLATAGIMDHDTIAGAEEFIAAGEILGLPTTVGLECRVDFGKTEFANQHLNNPDQPGIAYMALHGVPHQHIEAVSRYFEPVRQARWRRNQIMTERLNALIAEATLRLDFDTDIVAMSQWQQGGQITERHLLFALAQKLIARYLKPRHLFATLKEDLGVRVPDSGKEKLLDAQNPYREYDLLGILKSDWLGKIYLPATGDECPPLTDLVDFCQSHSIILAYAYLGDVTESVTGDKKAQTFEDAFLPDLLELLVKHDVRAVTYMPSRNSRAQLVRLRNLCAKLDLFQISGEDINQPRQSFVCEAMRDPLFANLHEAAWALIGHELASSENPDDGLFSPLTWQKWPQLEPRVQAFSCQAKARYASQKEG